MLRGCPARGEQARIDFARARQAVDQPLPHFRRLLGDDRGNAWVADYSIDYLHPPRFRVFSQAGEWLGWVRMPERFTVPDVRGGLVLASATTRITSRPWRSTG